MSDDSDLQALLDSGGGHSAPASSDNLQALLDSGGTSHTPEEVAQSPTDTRKTVYDASRPAIGDSIEQVAHQLVSGAYHSVVGGYKGLSTLARTRDPNQAADAVREEQGQTFQAPPSIAKSALESPVNPMNWPSMAGPAVGKFAQEHGVSPGLATAIDTGIQTAPMALGIKGVKMARETGPMGDLASNAQDVVNKAHAQQNMGAAAAATDVTKAPSEIQQAIVDAGPNHNADALNRHLEAASLPVPIPLTKGQATRNPTQISDELNARGKLPAFADRFNQQNEALIGNLDEIRRESAPTAVGNDHVQNGQAILDRYKEYDAPIKADISAKYKALTDANGGALPIDTGTFLSKVDATLKKQYLTKSVPPAGQEALDSLRSGEPLDFENFEALRTRLAEAQRKGSSEGAAAGVIRNELEQMPLSPEASKLKGLADEARSAAKARFSALDKDPAYQAAVDDAVPAGESSPLSDTFVKKFVIGGKKANLELMKNKFAADPEAQGTIKAAALNYLKSKAGIDPYSNEGSFSQHGYNKALAELEPRMDSLLDPQTADQVRALGNVARNIKSAPVGNVVNHSNTFSAAAGEKAKGFALDVVDSHTLGMGGKLINRLTKGRSDDAFVNDALAPGAGIKR